MTQTPVTGSNYHVSQRLKTLDFNLFVFYTVQYTKNRKRDSISMSQIRKVYLIKRGGLPFNSRFFKPTDL